MLGNRDVDAAERAELEALRDRVAEQQREVAATARALTAELRRRGGIRTWAVQAAREAAQRAARRAMAAIRQAIRKAVARTQARRGVTGSRRGEPPRAIIGSQPGPQGRTALVSHRGRLAGAVLAGSACLLAAGLAWRRQRGPGRRGPGQRGPGHRGPGRRGPGHRGPARR